MEEIRQFAEQLCALTGLTGTSMRVLTDATLVVAVLIISWLAYKICRGLIAPLLVKFVGKTSATWDDVVFNKKTLRAACMLVPAIIIWMFIPDVFARHPDLEEFLARLTAIYITVMAMKLAMSVVNSFKEIGSASDSPNRQYLHTFCGVANIIVGFICLIVMVAIAIGKSPLTLFAGLGATSAVLMLVFQDTLTGMLAGLRLTSNKMVKVGDWIRVDNAGINGTVEEITLTTVKVRNFDNTILTVSPKTLVDETFQNMQTMCEGPGRRVSRELYLDFHSIHLVDEELAESLVAKGYAKKEDIKENTVNLTLFRQYMDYYITNCEGVAAEMSCVVRESDPTANGLPVEFYFFTKAKDWKPYEYQTSIIMEYVYAILPDFQLSVYQRV